MVPRCRTILRGVLVALLGGLWLLEALFFETPLVQAEASTQLVCSSAEICFSEVKSQAEANRGMAASRLKPHEAVKKLQRAMALEPQSRWGKRSALLAGVLLREQDGAQALTFLKDREEDFPILEDYVKFWRAEALSYNGEASEAATLFSRLSQATDSLLRHRATLKSGEAWYQADQCEKAMVGLGKAMATSSKFLSKKAPTVLLKLADCQIRTIKKRFAPWLETWASPIGTSRRLPACLHASPAEPPSPSRH